VQGAEVGPRHRHALREAARVRIDRPELGLQLGAAPPTGHEEDLPVRRPAPDVIGAGVVREARRPAALHGHDEDVGVPVVLPGKGHPLAVGREVGLGFRAGEAGEPLGVPAVRRHDPEVVGVGEDDGAVLDGRLPQKAGALAEGDGREQAGEADEQERPRKADEAVGHGRGGSMETRILSQDRVQNRRRQAPRHSVSPDPPCA